MKPKVFISYRREDSLAAVGRIYDRLGSHFGADSVFMDVDSIPPGVDFRDHLASEVSRCDVVLAIIGKQWPGVLPGGERRIDDSGDFVHVEIGSALSRDIPVVPVLVGSTPMPSEGDLPEALSSLAYRNAFQVDLGKDFHHHMDELIAWLEKVAVSPQADEGRQDPGGEEFASPMEMPAAKTGTNLKAGRPKHDPYAVGAFCLGLVTCVLPPFGAIAVAMGHISLGRIRDNPLIKGRNLSILALIVGYAWIVGTLVMFANAGFREMSVSGG